LKPGTPFASSRLCSPISLNTFSTARTIDRAFTPNYYAQRYFGGNAVGGAPYLHAVDAASGGVLWQQEVAGPTYAAAAEANGVVFIGGTDFTFRALDLLGGDILWERELSGAVSGGAVVVGDDVIAVAGIRAPGVDTTSDNSGVYRFSLSTDGGATPSASSATNPVNRTAAPRRLGPARATGWPLGG